MENKYQKQSERWRDTSRTTITCHKRRQDNRIHPDPDTMVSSNKIELAREGWKKGVEPSRFYCCEAQATGYRQHNSRNSSHGSFSLVKESRIYSPQGAGQQFFTQYNIIHIVWCMFMKYGKCHLT